MNTEIERQKITINDLNEEIERMDEIIRANRKRVELFYICIMKYCRNSFEFQTLD